jgi:hypothetical protein
MNRTLILGRLQQLTGSLKPAPGTSVDELHALQRSLAEQLVTDPGFTVSGNRLHHESAQADPTADLSAQLGHLDTLLSGLTAAVVPGPTPLVFRRETGFSNNLLGNSVPSWASGMAPTKTFGPFLDEHGLKIWFDFYFAVRLVQVFFQGSPTPALLIPIWGTLTGKTSYTVEAGSVWIASELLAKSSALSGYYTGLKVRGGSLELSHPTVVTSGKVFIPLAAAVTLHLDLDQKSVTPSAVEAGIDARDAIINLPRTLELNFTSLSGSVAPGDASCTVFGCEVDFRFRNAAPVWISAIGQILIPYSVRSTGGTPDTFTIVSSTSGLCTLAQRAKIHDSSGWLLPAAKTDPQQLGQAAGTGALCISLSKGITANWKGLQGAKTSLVHPAILAEPGMVTVVDFFANNLNGKQKWVAWRNAASRHHSEITLAFGAAFPFIFVSSAKNSEAIFFFCGHKASFDRPVDANGSPFRIESTLAFAGILQNGDQFQALLLDNDLLFDGNPNKAGAFERHSLILRNALFSVSRPYSLFLFGKLENENEITKGVLVLMFGVYLYLPTLPDPYVASYTGFLGDRVGREFGQLRTGLAAFVKWPNPAEPPFAGAEIPDDPAYVYFRFAPLEKSAFLGTLAAGPQTFLPKAPVEQPARTFQTGVRTFNAALRAGSPFSLPVIASEPVAQPNPFQASTDPGLVDRVQQSLQSNQLSSVIADFEENPLLNHIQDKTLQVNETLRAALRNAHLASGSEAFFAATGITDTQPALFKASPVNRGRFFAPDLFLLLDVSTNADQMGVSLGNAIEVHRDPRGETNLFTVGAALTGAATRSELQFQILNMDVVVSAQNLRATTLPQISWEPVWNIPLKIEGPPDPQDLVTIAPGILVYDNDGIPTRIFSESPYTVPIAPLPVTRHFVKEFNDKQAPRQLHSIFTLPFALIAQADFQRQLKGAADQSARVSFNQPYFGELHGGLQIKSLAPRASSNFEKPSFPGFTVQLDGNLRWFLWGLPITGSTLGRAVKEIFNSVFMTQKPKVPLEKMEISGYGASIFSNWLSTAAAIADVSQAKFDVVVGRTGHEVIQVRSVMYMQTGCVQLVRTITLMRSADGYVFRSDSGWKAESDAFFDCDYKIDFALGGPLVDVNNTYEFHPGAIRGVSNVREIRDYPEGGSFKSSFSLNQSGLPDKLGIKDLPTWKKVFANLTSLDDQLPVDLQAVVFDGDVHFENVKSGGVKDPQRADFKVQSRKMLGYVQLSPSSILIPPKILANLLNFQNGSIGGPVDCTIDIASSGQRMRVARVDLNPALDGAGRDIFAAAARGSLILPPDGSWSVVKQRTDTGDVKPVEEGQSVPLIKPNGGANFLIANPADVVQATSKTNFGVVQSTGTQKLLFDIPQFSPGETKLKSDTTYFADAYKLLNAKSIFPNVANALQLTNAEKEVDILGEGLMKMADRDVELKNLLPSNYQYAFIDEPKILKIYAQYKSTTGTGGKLKLGIDSAAALADRWKAALSNIRIVVDLGPFTELMWVDGNFNASSGLDPKYDVPHLQFGPVLQPVVDILQILATLSGDDFDKGMNVGMSNSPDNWEYKFNCSKEIPVIKFPSPEELTLDPTPPLKLEAGLKVGFYFNEVLSIPTDIKQLVPACGAFVAFTGGLHVMCFSLQIASIYAVGQVELGIAADTKAGIVLHMKFGFGVEIVVGLPVVLNVSVLYMVEVDVGISSTTLDVGAMMLFRGSAEICGGLVAICIQIEAGGGIHRDLVAERTDCIAQVTFSIDVTVLWVIDLHTSDTWQESRQIA